MGLDYLGLDHMGIRPNGFRPNGNAVILIFEGCTVRYQGEE